MIPFPYSRALLTRRRAVSGNTDPYFSNVSLLLHMNGADGSTTFTDNSPNSFTISVNGNAQIDTDQSKFGGASAIFDGAGDYITAPNDVDFNFGSGNFTVEFFVKKNRNATEEGLIAYGPVGQSTAFAPLMLIRWNSGNTIQAYLNTATNASSVFGNITSSSTYTSTTNFYHIAYTRSGTSFYLFVDGNLAGTATSSSSQGTDASSLMCIGRDNRTNAFYFQGHIDELRITKGVARYTSSFTPPSAQFPDS